MRIYAHDGSKVLQRICDRGSKGAGLAWEDQLVLPMGISSTKIRENFIALLWPVDADNTASEVHLFSTENGMLHDYSLGVAPGGVYSLVKSGYE